MACVWCWRFDGLSASELIVVSTNRHSYTYGITVRFSQYTLIVQSGCKDDKAQTTTSTYPFARSFPGSGVTWTA